MSKRKRGFTLEKYKKWIKEGRGIGIGAGYKPWIRIQDVSSEGRSTRIRGDLTDRQHDFLSDLERNYFLIISFSEQIVDIREQYPLLPIEETIGIANEIGIKHPMDPQTQELIVLTTDFLLTKNENEEYINLARTIKPSSDLENRRIIEKFEIERVYWDRKGVDWGIVTDREIDKTFARNVQSIYKFHKLIDFACFRELNDQQVDKLVKTYISKLGNGTIDIRLISEEFDQEMQFQLGTGLLIFKHLLITHRIKLNMLRKINFDKPIDLEIMDYAKGLNQEAL